MRYTNAALPSRPWFCEHRNTITTYAKREQRDKAVRPQTQSRHTSGVLRSGEVYLSSFWFFVHCTWPRARRRARGRGFSLCTPRCVGRCS